MNYSNQPTPAILTGYIYILATVVLTVYGQLVLKWRVAKAGVIPATLVDKIAFLFGLICNPWILSSLVAGFFAFLCWTAALTKFELSYAYPFMSLSFLLVLIASAILFDEPLTMSKALGVTLVIVGLIIASRG